MGSITDWTLLHAAIVPIIVGAALFFMASSRTTSSQKEQARGRTLMLAGSVLTLIGATLIIVSQLFR
ncbi:hypothetical protein Uis1B_1964 [Bifidobacterium margollesii]|uniref:Uncharacterized protein n=1 Tax=Bifidobacterium margollesii TaxID=2020964 RepID=A0A2N5J7M9_9BIFI|nr:hypothetical protein [Bifidobacterium margollesii]PLS30197.1 hypothetical protein Uis1B_1964 [Bifidobacterium margollesii]